MTLRVLTYLAPSIPLGLFELVVERLRRVLGVRATLRAEARHSGPPPDVPDPFSADEADLAFLCSPSFAWLSGMRPSPIELVPAAPVFLEPRTAGRPVYFSDVIVHRGVAPTSFEELRGRRWAYNDRCSLSGYFNLLARLRVLGEDRHFLRTARRSGSHLRSVELTARGEVDGAAVDSNVLALLRCRDPLLCERVRVVASWGPYAVQPIVVRGALPATLKTAIARILLAMGREPPVRAALAAFGVGGFAPTSRAAYEADLAALGSDLHLAELPVAEGRVQQCSSAS